jgi:hypothetical protein
MQLYNNKGGSLYATLHLYKACTKNNEQSKHHFYILQASKVIIPLHRSSEHQTFFIHSLQLHYIKSYTRIILILFVVVVFTLLYCIIASL